MSGRHRCSRPPMGQASTASPRPPAELKRADANARHTPSHVSRGSVREGIGLRTSCCVCVVRTTRPTNDETNTTLCGCCCWPSTISRQHAGVVGRGGRYRPAPKRDAEVLEETPNSNPNIAAAFATSHDLAVICLRSVLQELTKKRPGNGDKSVNKTWTSTLHNATNTRRRASCSHQAPHPGKCLTRTRITSTCGTRTQQTQPTPLTL